jgi:hypothetical protein
MLHCIFIELLCFCPTCCSFKQYGQKYDHAVTAYYRFVVLIFMFMFLNLDTFVKNMVDFMQAETT